MNIRSKLLLIGERKSTLRFAKGSFSASEIFQQYKTPFVVIYKRCFDCFMILLIQ